MTADEDHFRREEDRKWRESVEARLVSLTSAQKTTDDHLEKLENGLEEIAQLLEGDPLKRNDTGLKGDVKELTVEINELRAIMAPDAFGHGGIKNRLTACEEALGLKTQTSKYRWLVVLGIISASSAVTVAVVENLDRIAGAYTRWTHAKPIAPPRKKHTARKHRPEPREDDAATGEDVPEMR